MLALRSGQDGVFDHLVLRHRDPLLLWFRRRGHDDHSAEDCAQETLLRVFRASARYDDRAPFGAFLLRLARSVHVDWWRRQRRHRQGQDETPQAEASVEGGGAPLTEPEPGGRLDLWEAVAELPARLRDVVRLSVRDGLSYAEIAAALGIPRGTVKSRMFVAVRRLRERLDDD